MDKIILGKNGNQIIIDNEPLSFDYPILQYVEISGMLIVLLEIPPRTAFNNNVFGIDIKERRVKWQMNVHNHYTRFSKYCPFINIMVYDGRLRLNNWCSFDLFVDPSNGNKLETIESR